MPPVACITHSSLHLKLSAALRIHGAGKVLAPKLNMKLLDL